MNELLLSTISTPSVGYRVGILNNGEEKSKRVDPSKSNDANCGGESDHKLAEEEGELVNDGREVVWYGNSKLEKSSHGAGHGPFSGSLGSTKTVSSCAPSCSWGSGSASTSGPAISGRANIRSYRRASFEYRTDHWVGRWGMPQN